MKIREVFFYGVGIGFFLAMIVVFVFLSVCDRAEKGKEEESLQNEVAEVVDRIEILNSRWEDVLKDLSSLNREAVKKCDFMRGKRSHEVKPVGEIVEYKKWMEVHFRQQVDNPLSRILGRHFDGWPLETGQRDVVYAKIFSLCEKLGIEISLRGETNFSYLLGRGLPVEIEREIEKEIKNKRLFFKEVSFYKDRLKELEAYM